MKATGFVLVISTVMVLFVDDISSDINRLNGLKNTFYQSDGRSSESRNNDENAPSFGNLNMNLIDLFDICKDYKSKPTVLNNELRRAMTDRGISAKMTTNFSFALESYCPTFFTPKPRRLMRAHQNLAKLSLTADQPKKFSKTNIAKAKQLGKPAPLYNVTSPVAPLVKTAGNSVTGSEAKSTQRRDSETNKPVEPADVFPANSSGPFQVVQVPGKEPVATPSPEINAPDSFPNNPQYDLSNITQFQKKIGALMEKINHIVAHNNTSDNIHGSLDVIHVINELKVNLDQWSRSVNTSNEASKIKQENETLQTNLLKSKIYLAQLIHELAQNKTDPSELTCKINSLYEEIQNLTNIDIGFFNMAVDNDDIKINCNESINWNCTESNVTAPVHHAESDIESLSFHPNIFSILAICFAAISILSYVGLISWRYYLERRYGTRQLLTNEDTEFYDSAPDVHPFEIRTEVL